MARKDGRLLDSRDAMHLAAPYVMQKRYDSLNMVTIDLPMEPMRAYLNAARREHPGLSYLGLVLTAYTRAVAKYPALKRFVVNRRIYCSNTFSMSMVVLRPGADSTMDKVVFDERDTVFDVNRRLGEFIARNRNAQEENKLDALLAFLVRHPILIGSIINFLMWLDRRGMLPQSVMEASPFHANLLISNLASIRLPQIYHHIYDFGTISVAITMGVPVKRVESDHGTFVEREYLPLGIVMDERIADGQYFGQVLRYIRHLLSHPQELEQPPEEVISDPTR